MVVAGGVLAGAGITAASTSVDLIGTWSCCGSGGAGAQTWKIVSISSSSGALKGSGGGGGETFPITGKASGRSVTLTTGPYRLLPSYSATFTGKVSTSGLTMSGTWKSNQHQSGTWSSKLTTPLKKLKPKPKPKPKPKRKPKPKPKKPAGKASSVKLRGPSHNTYHTAFNYTVSGFSGAANALVAWEAPPSPTCASTYTAESKRPQLFLFLKTSVKRQASFSHVIHFYAQNHAKHRLCAYLYGSATHVNYAHAGASWTNS